MGFHGGCTDGAFAYYSPQVRCPTGGTCTYHGRAVRIPLGNFAASAVEVVNMQDADALLAGFWGNCMTDDAYVYFSPGVHGNPTAPTEHGNMARVRRDDWSASGVDAIAIEGVEPEASSDTPLKTFAGAFIARPYGYLTPAIGEVGGTTNGGRKFVLPRQ